MTTEILLSISWKYIGEPYLNELKFDNKKAGPRTVARPTSRGSGNAHLSRTSKLAEASRRYDTQHIPTHVYGYTSEYEHIHIGIYRLLQS